MIIRRTSSTKVKKISVNKYDEKNEGLSARGKGRTIEILISPLGE